MKRFYFSLLLSLSISFIWAETFTVNGVTFEMVPVEGGQFLMGSDDADAFDNEKPAHKETVNDFSIGKTEVTQALWETVMGSNPSFHKGSDLPVENVSWEDCTAFITKLNEKTGKNFRLPTEAEWEFAARGGKKSKNYKYSGSNAIEDVAWHLSNSGEKTHPVAMKTPNELGLYDMTGNVSEWTSDKWSANYDSARNGGSSGDYRTYRGGNWNSDSWVCHTSYRDRRYESGISYCLGFRIAL